MIRAGETGHRASLTRRDMIVFEQRLVDAVAGLFPFKSHSMHFPRRLDDAGASWIAGEKKLLLPLTDNAGDILGVFVARGVQTKTATSLLPHWPALRALIADNLLLFKRSLCDPVTGLFSRHYLLRAMEREIEALRDPFRTYQMQTPGQSQAQSAGQPQGSVSENAGEALRPGVEGLVAGDEETHRRSSLATLVVRLAALRDVVREFGYQFGDELMIALADALVGACPERALAARTGDSEFTVHLPSSGPRACRALAGEIVQALRKVYLVHPLRREQVGIYATVGYTLYPQDIAGNLFVRPPAQIRYGVLPAEAVANGKRPHPDPLTPSPNEKGPLHCRHHTSTGLALLA